MTTDTMLVLAIIAIAALFLLRRLLTRRRDADCAGGCSGCAAHAPSRQPASSHGTVR